MTPLPCPFCGETPGPLSFARTGYGVGRQVWRIRCPDPECYAEGPGAATVEEAAERWNRRPVIASEQTPSDLPERLEWLAEAVTEWDHPITARQDCLSAAAELRRLTARLAVKCAQPGGTECANLWQADTNERQLKSVSPELADEFPWGCDTVEHLAEALVASRKIVSRLPKTADGVPITPGMTLWDKIGGHKWNVTGFNTRDGKLCCLYEAGGFDAICSGYYSTREAAEAAGKETP
jgi:hypothetical protein